ncbi:phospholipase A [Eoetvoesiella caeni]|uniref:Phospholipase A1 n=1 Tax=Eoetvoesiella caeni TaxID=645616 RepID=A0A366HBJ4_9BURK|nr:phospholipase A [Eoetvoesiella caeni]MCI2809610.1 phospholipase A [Eoetvoesiella caeni]NYT56106.1 phospholipase A [Eoetvoesiella caeni]RBP38871.1 outer membrane phospholipase A [Eoetvoesiella caeni]
MNSTSSFLARALLVIPALWACQAQAGITYQLDSVHATNGETVRIKGMLFNDTANSLSWKPPKTLVLQWRAADGHAVRSLAYLDRPSEQINLPVNNFAALSWSAVVPKAVKGLQAINIEGEQALLALDTSPLEKSAVTGTPAMGPVIDAGIPAQQPQPPLPNNVVAATGASIHQGPPPASASLGTAPSAFENFRTAISPYEPIYFDVGTKGGTNARFQISFKYRLSSPSDSRNPGFMDHWYLGYTQTSLWDLEGRSKPFVDSTYNPSLFWHNDTLWQSQDKDWYAGLNAGVEHKSNGKSGADSRSINDAYLQPELNYRFNGGSTLTFAPRIKGYFSKKENPDYADYAGYVDWKLRWAQDNGLILTGLYRQGKQGHNSAQLEAAWPLRRTFLNMNGYLHVQYFKGYGETLLGYNQNSGSQVRVGLSLVP